VNRARSEKNQKPAGPEAEQASQVQRLVTRAQIAETLWGAGRLCRRRTGNTAVSKIRIALEDDSAQPRYLQTVVGRGYRWVTPLC